MKLLPCPFCGSPAEFGEVPNEPDDPNAGGEFVVCTNIGCETSTALVFPCGDDPKPLLAARWNRRTERTNG